MRTARIAILDYGMGNLRSVEKALEHVGAEAIVTHDHGEIRAASAIVLPGVGAFPRAIEAIRSLGLDTLISERLAAGTPTLGICLGMQMLFDHSSEQGGADGLGLIAGSVEPLAANGLKLPQIGWNEVVWAAQSPLLAGLPDPCALYHVHSLAPRPDDPAVILGHAGYGRPFVTAVADPPLYGLQFHPEKSGPAGLRLLGNFASIAVDALGAAA
ncbi:MAG: imidazole glycerol phosphate synthase subunit HisH [Thermoleophilaceae bacterium]